VVSLIFELALSAITDSVQALVEALNEFEGGVVVVSHDQSLVSQVCQLLYLVENGGVHRWERGLDAYVDKVLAAARKV